MSYRVGRRATRPIGWLAMLVALGVTACSAPATEAGPDPSGTVEISYHGAEQWLAGLDPAEAGQQVQDWARLGLASALRMNADQLLDAFYDGDVLRDSALDGLAEQPVASGRALFHDGTLHLLVSEDDPAPERTIGELLDQRRADAGADPARVQVHTYRIDGRERQVVLTGQDTEPTAQARADNGWVERRIDTPAALADFASHADRLTRLETRGNEIWAQGWDWPDISPVVTPEDVAVLQRGYLPPSRQLPGFSLDPGQAQTPADLQAVLPGLSPALAEALGSGDYGGSGYASATQLRDAVGDALFHDRPAPPGVPADRTHLWALFQHLDGGLLFNQARYDGGLEGTEVGMTLFYTDYVAKDWTFGVGTGVPAGRVPGFVPDDRARTPPDFCRAGDAAESESGRLWFGQNDAAFRYGADGVSIGRQATRLFAKADAAGGEADPSYRLGRGLGWWDRNFRAVADYEPQYRRLDELMRWSGALEWLTRANRSLPTADASTDPGLTFASWYAEHTELRERSGLAVVHPPSAGGREAVLTVPSRAFSDCGIEEIRGGVSLADAGARHGDLPQPTPLPGDLSRAGPLDGARTSVDATGAGRITRDGSEISHQLRRGPGVAGVDTSGPPSQAVRFGEGRLATDEGRTQSLTFRSDEQGKIEAAQSIENQLVGHVTVSPTETGVQLSVVGATVARLKAFVERIHTDPANGATAIPEFRYRYDDSSGTVHRLEGLWIRTGPASPGIFAERLGIETRNARGEPQHVATGAPRKLSTEDLAGLETTGEPRQVRTTAGALFDSIPTGTDVYTDSPTLLIEGISVTVPITIVYTFAVERGTAPAAAAGGNGQGAVPGSPGSGGSQGTPPTTEPPGGGPRGGGPVPEGEWRWIGVGSGPGSGPSGPVLVSVCPTDETATQPQECPQ